MYNLNYILKCEFIYVCLYVCNQKKKKTIKLLMILL